MGLRFYVAGQSNPKNHDRGFGSAALRNYSDAAAAKTAAATARWRHVTRGRAKSDQTLGLE